LNLSNNNGMTTLSKLTSLITILVLAAILLRGCRGSDDQAKVPPGFNPAVILSSWRQPEAIITRAQVAEIAGVDSSLISVHQENMDEGSSKSTLLFSWPTGASVKLNSKYSIPVYHSVGLAFADRTSAESFEEKFTGPNYLKKQVNEITRDSLVAPDIAIAEAKYLAQYAKDRRIIKVPGVGDAAYWEMPLQALHIRVKEVAFTITTNLGDDESKNRRRAISIAKKIFNHQ